MIVFFDASVIIAALLSPTGGSAMLFKYIKLGIIVGITSQTAIEEIIQEDKPTKINRSKGRDKRIYCQKQFINQRSYNSR